MAGRQQDIHVQVKPDAKEKKEKKSKRCCKGWSRFEKWSLTTSIITTIAVLFIAGMAGYGIILIVPTLRNANVISTQARDMVQMASDHNYMGNVGTMLDQAKNLTSSVPTTFVQQLQTQISQFMSQVAATNITTMGTYAHNTLQKIDDALTRLFGPIRAVAPTTTHVPTMPPAVVLDS